MDRNMDPVFLEALEAQLLAMADDELILAHRNSEWTGHGPILEEDIAFSNIAQDEMGHATLWYRIVQQLTGANPDGLVFFRDTCDFRNVQMVELPKGDWAFSMLRQFLFDTSELIRLVGLAASSFKPIAEAAAKIRLEEIYHLRHTRNWVRRLGLGTEESNRRMQTALDALWPYARQLFVSLPGEELLVQQGVIQDPAEHLAEWLHLVEPILKESGLSIPTAVEPCVASRAMHTPHLESLLLEMQMVPRLFPDASW
jgi:ring-1,2-phenylacetyl-CoA epoxidase subunit PaaC